MKIWCLPFLCFRGEEDCNKRIGDRTSAVWCWYSLYCYNKEREPNRVSILANESEEMESDDDSGLGLSEAFHNFGGGRVDERANERVKDEMFEFEGDIGETSEDFLHRINNAESTSAGGSGVQRTNVDVNLNLGLGGEASSSSLLGVNAGRENCDRDTQNKRPKVHSFSL